MSADDRVSNGSKKESAVTPGDNQSLPVVHARPNGAERNSLGERLASSASSLGRAAFAAGPSDLNAALAAQLQANEKHESAHGAAGSSSAASEQYAQSSKSASVNTARGNAPGETFRSATHATPLDEDDAFAAPAELPESASVDEVTPAQPTRPPNQAAPQSAAQNSHFSADDGAAVIALLNTPGSLTSTEDFTQMTDAPEPSASSLFGASSTPDPLQIERKLRSALPSPPVHGSVAVDNPLNLRPAGFEDDDEGFLAGWRDVLERYTDDVWDPQSRPWIEEARVELRKIQQHTAPEGTQLHDEQRATSVRRLRQILGHVQRLHQVYD